MNVMIIPDLHGRKFWREAISNNIDKVDKVIFLGDYLDPYSEEIQMTPELMECNNFYDSQNLLKMLEDIISLKKNEPDKYILLTGNHTDSYIWSDFNAASRTDYKNWEKYHKIFSQNLDLFNLVWIENDVIFSHAGISQGWAKRMWKSFEYPESEFKSIMDIALAINDIPLTKFNNYVNIISDISRYRGGDMFYGSSEWADIREHINFKESTSDSIISNIKEEGIFQVFGHSQVKIPIRSNNWICLDCRKGFIFDTITHDCNSCL